MSFWRIISFQTVCGNLPKYLMSAAFHSFNWFHLHLGHKLCQTEMKTKVINSSLKASSKAAKAWTTIHVTLFLPQAKVGCKYMQCASSLHYYTVQRFHSSYLRSLADTSWDFFANTSSPPSLSAFLLPRTDAIGSASGPSLPTAFLQRRKHTGTTVLVAKAFLR